MTETTTAPNSLADLAQKARASVTKAEAAAAKLEALAAAWPAALPVTFATDVGAHVAISAEVETREAAAAYLAALNLEPVAYARGTFTILKPLAWFKPGELEAAKVAITADLMPAVWRYGHGRAELQAWPRVAEGVRVQLTITIARDPARHVVEYDRPNHRDRRVTRDELHGAPNGEAIRWSSGGGDTPHTFSVWFYQEPGGAAPALADLLAQQGRVI